MGRICFDKECGNSVLSQLLGSFEHKEIPGEHSRQHQSADCRSPLVAHCSVLGDPIWWRLAVNSSDVSHVTQRVGVVGRALGNAGEVVRYSSTV